MCPGMRHIPVLVGPALMLLYGEERAEAQFTLHNLDPSILALLVLASCAVVLRLLCS